MIMSYDRLTMSFNRLWATVYAVARNAALPDTTRPAKAGRLAWRLAWRATSWNAPQRAQRVAEEAQGRRPGVREFQRTSYRFQCYHDAVGAADRALDAPCHVLRAKSPTSSVRQIGPSSGRTRARGRAGPSSGRTMPRAACRIATSRRATDRNEFWTNAGAWGPSSGRTRARGCARPRAAWAATKQVQDAD